MSQDLGLHSNHAIMTDPAEEVQRRIRLFWALYAIEKAVSLRLGRSSTIRDHDITVPRLILDRKMTSLAYNRLPDWIDVARLYGRVYDNIYSPHALAQPASVRDHRTRSLAAELERIMAARVEFYVRCSYLNQYPIPSSKLGLTFFRNGQTSGRAMKYTLGWVGS